MEILKSRLKSLLLTTMARNLEHRNQYAMENRISYLEFLELLVEDQWSTRQDTSYKNRLRESHLLDQKTMDHFNFAGQWAPHAIRSLPVFLTVWVACGQG